ncbi:DUF2306 domain-containing protein [Streptosporangium carneum]|uniref:DUF2306 domain-containing protein n=1 Tax=Streptosporangium carneum TaxID=47481 RepID=A0A9W6MEV6_9ACTN|nr:DUF2306 domain-containing protein [Streptosporangium carneum]GLK11395.1 hypothetical protein GCM10017600_48020 [Streptosporangium carneum]
MTVVEERARRGSTRRRAVGWWWFVLTAVAIAVIAPLPYLTDSLRTLADGNDEFAANYAAQAPWMHAVFYAHIVFAAVALVLSPVQFAARLRARAPRLHRICGRVAMGCIGLGGVAGLLLAPVNLAGPVGTAGFGALAVLWLAFAVAAYRAIRRGDVAAHRRWAVRTFAMTYAGVMLRVWLPVLTPLLTALGGVDPDVAFTRAYLIVPFLCWVPNLLVAEVVLRTGGGGHAATRTA